MRGQESGFFGTYMLWLECYRAVSSYQIDGKNTHMRSRVLDVFPTMTLRRAVFSSPARVNLAHALGWQFDADSSKYTLKHGAKSSNLLHWYTGSVACRAALAEAHRLGMPLLAETLNGAALSGELSTVIWLHTEHHCEFNSGTGDYSAMGGHIEMLRWLKQQGLAFSSSTMLSAASYGHTPTCAYLHAAGCPWDRLVVFAAARRSHWGTVRWLLEHGCPCKFDSICFKAVAQGSIETMAFMLQQQAVPAAILSKMLDFAGANNQLAAAQWLRQRGAAWPLLLQDRGDPWSGDVLEWARGEGCDSPLD
jgi:hypothetical protein